MELTGGLNTLGADKSGHPLDSAGEADGSRYFVFIEGDQVVKRRQSIFDDRVFRMTQHSDQGLDRVALKI